MTVAVARATPAGSTRWRQSLLALGGAAAAILLLLRGDVLHLLTIWWTSTTFGHCLLVGPIVAWLVWTRREQLSGLTPRGWWPGLGLVLIGGAAWLAGDAGSVAFARQLGLVVMLQGAVVTILGPQVARGLLFPLLFALFLVPFGAWLEAPLQGVTVALVLPLLHLVGLPAASDGVMIHAGRYYFEVAEECSGARFVIAMFILGVLVAQVGFLSWRRRAVFLLACLVVPVLANGVRAFATIWVADLTSVEIAGGFDHIVYGWVFFGLVMAALLGGAWRWFDRPADAPAFDPARLPDVRGGGVSLPLALVLTLAAAAFPAWSALLASRAAPVPPPPGLPSIAGWHRVAGGGAGEWHPFYPGADRLAFARYADAAGRTVDVAVAAYARQRQGRELVGAGLGVLAPGDRWLRVADLPEIDGGAAMRLVAPGPVHRVVATWYRVGGVTTADPVRVKLETLRTRLLGGDTVAVAIHLSAPERPGEDAAATIRAFRAKLGPVERLAPAG